MESGEKVKPLSRFGELAYNKGYGSDPAGGLKPTDRGQSISCGIFEKGGGQEMKYYRTFRNYMECFLVFSLSGWLYEVIWCGLIEQNMGFINRGFLFGPWLPIYGFGMIIILELLKRFRIRNPWLVFAFGVAVAVVAELIASYLMEALIGEFLWDYRGYFMNFQGRIALKPDLMFGFLILAGVFIVQPFLARIQDRYDDSRIHNLSFWLVLILFIIDLIARIPLGSNFTGAVGF